MNLCDFEGVENEIKRDKRSKNWGRKGGGDGILGIRDTVTYSFSVV